MAPQADANGATDHQTRTRQPAQVKRKVTKAGLTDRINVHIDNFKVRTASDSHAAQRDRALQAVTTGERAAAHKLPVAVISSKIAEFKLRKAGDCPAAQRARAKRDAAFGERAAARSQPIQGSEIDEFDRLFHAAHQFQGYWYGRVFKNGSQGVGYYTDYYSTEMSVAEWEQRCAGVQQRPVPADSRHKRKEISPHVKLQAEEFLQSLQASMDTGIVLSESQLEISQKATHTLARDAGVDAVQLARCRKAAGDAFNAKEAMWTWTHERLVAQQVSAA